MGAELRFLEFFAGAGLVRLALEPEWACVWANDIDPRKADVYRANFGAAEFALGDVAGVSANVLPAHSQLAWASFPCQDLSLAGWRRGMSAERSGTFWAFWRIVRDLFDAGAKPPLIVIENVVGLLYGDNFNGLCEAFAALNMRFGALVIDARWFVPQSRPRVFFVAVDAGLSIGQFEEVLPEGQPWFTKPIWKAWRELPPPLASRWVLIEREPDGVRWHSPAETQRLLDLMAPNNRERVDRALAAPGRSASFTSARAQMDSGRRSALTASPAVYERRRPGQAGRRLLWWRMASFGRACSPPVKLRDSWAPRTRIICQVDTTTRIARWVMG